MASLSQSWHFLKPIKNQIIADSVYYVKNRHLCNQYAKNALKNSSMAIKDFFV